VNHPQTLVLLLLLSLVINYWIWPHIIVGFFFLFAPQSASIFL